MRRAFALVAVALLVALPALPAFAKSYTLPWTDVRIDVQPDGSMIVTEQITYDFSGDFSGAYRDVPIGSGMTIGDVTVSEGELPYSPGACTELGCTSPASTFGTRNLGDTLRVVWHYRAFSERRTFTIRYRVEGGVKVYDDVAEVNWKVWGDEWTVGLDNLEAGLTMPGDVESGDVRVWGHPASVRGETDLGTDGASPHLLARSISAGQFVEMRVTFPADVLTSTAGATQLEGDGLPDILAEEAEAVAARERMEASIRWLLFLGPALAIVPALAVGLVIYWKFGREPRIDYDREYEQEPPTDLTPAEVGALLTQGKVGPEAFTSTLFDLIRKGAISAESAQVERSTWMGLRSEMISDLQLSMAEEPDGLTGHEQKALEIMRRALADGPVPLHELRDEIRTDASANASAYRSFQSKITSLIKDKHLLFQDGAKWAGSALGILVALAVLVGVLVAVFVDNVMFLSIIVPVLIVIGVINAVILVLFLVNRRAMSRRSKAGAMQAARWEAFRRYLEDFSRIEEAPPISLALWDKFLVYGIALGVAEEVLEAARLHAPVELENTSRIYWYGGHGYTGGGTESAFAGLNSALTGAFNPPSSSSGGGGGFSGGGGFGGGGGGGGAW